MSLLTVMQLEAELIQLLMDINHRQCKYSLNPYTLKVIEQNFPVNKRIFLCFI